MQAMPQAPAHTPVRTGADMKDIGVNHKPENFTTALSKLIMQHPFYAVVLMDALKVVFTDSVPTMATDGTTIYVNPEFSASLTVDENMFVICHEVLHYILQHIPRGKLYQDRGFGPDLKPYSHMRMNQAEDYIINDILKRGKVGVMPALGLHDVSIANFDDIADEGYGKIPEPPEQEGEGGGHGGFDEHLNPDPNANQPSQADVQRTVAQAQNAAKAQGKMPADLQRICGEILDPQQEWGDELRDEMSSAIGRDEATWARANRRRLCMQPSVFLPGTAGYAAGTVVVQIDTSGSVGDKELDAFRTEVVGILTDARPEQLIVLWVDSRVAGVDYVDMPEDFEDLEPKGGGGTDMTAGIRWIEENLDDAPSCFVCLTDGYTPWPEDPGYKTIWVISDDGPESPVGKSLRIKV